MNDPEFNDDAIVNFTKSVLEHGMFFHTDFETGFGNWRACGLRGLFIVTCLFPECKWAPEWRTFAVEQLEHYADTHLMPDGSNAEICSHYGNLALAHQSGFIFQADLCGYGNSIPQSYMDKLKTAYDFNLKIMTPDRKDIEIGGGRTAEAPGYVPDFSATGSLLASYYILERALELFPADKSYKWATGLGPAGDAPSEISSYIPYFGIALMRSGWDRQANLLTLKSSPYGLLHGSYDVNSISLWAYGRRIIWDSPISDGTPSTYHSTIAVDGRGQENVKAGTGLPINVDWKSSNNRDYASSVFDAYWGNAPDRRAEHYRRVVFVKPDIYIVIDDMVSKDNDSHKYESRWVLKSENVVSDSALKAARTTDPNTANLAIVPLIVSGTAATITPKSQDPYIKDEGKGSYQDLTVVTHTRTTTGDTRFVTLLLPLANGESNPVSSVTELSSVKWNVALSGNRALMIEADAGHDGNITVTETGGAGRNLTITGASVDRPFYSYFENFEIYDAAESYKMPYRNVFDKVKHQVAPPAGLTGAEGRWVGEVAVKTSGSTNARSTPTTPIPVGTPEIELKGMVGYPSPLQGNVRFRLSATFKDTSNQNTKVDGSWIDLGGGSDGAFVDYSATLTLPPFARSIQFVQIDVDQQGSGPAQTVYVDAIRVLFPGETEDVGPVIPPNNDLYVAEFDTGTDGFSNLVQTTHSGVGSGRITIPASGNVVSTKPFYGASPDLTGLSALDLNTTLQLSAPVVGIAEMRMTITYNLQSGGTTQINTGYEEVDSRFVGQWVTYIDTVQIPGNAVSVKDVRVRFNQKQSGASSQPVYLDKVIISTIN